MRRPISQQAEQDFALYRIEKTRVLAPYKVVYLLLVLAYFYFFFLAAYVDQVLIFSPLATFVYSVLVIAVWGVLSLRIILSYKKYSISVERIINGIFLLAFVGCIPYLAESTWYLYEYMFQISALFCVLYAPFHLTRFKSIAYIMLGYPLMILLTQAVAFVIFNVKIIDLAHILSYQVLAGIAAVVNVFVYERVIAGEYYKRYALLEKIKTQTANNVSLSKKSKTDALTALPNRGAMDIDFARLIKKAVMHNKPIGVLMIDIDHFKVFNDTYGHAEGDECLRKVARVLRKANAYIEEGGVYRYGGEEFALLAYDMDKDDLFRLAEQMRSAVMKLNIPNIKAKERDFVTISLGLSFAYVDEDDSPKRIFKQADLALYDAKKQGRNMTVIFGNRG